jgi:hypothetical protein
LVRRETSANGSALCQLGYTAEAGEEFAILTSLEDVLVVRWLGVFLGAADA